MDSTKNPQAALLCPEQWGKAELPKQYKPKPLLVLPANAKRTRTTAEPRDPNGEAELKRVWECLHDAYASELTRLQHATANIRVRAEQPLLEGADSRSWAQTYALLKHCKVVSPEPNQSFTLAESLEWLTLQYKNRQRFPFEVVAIGFKPFWQPIVAQFLQGSRVTHVKDVATYLNTKSHTFEQNTVAVIWGRQPDEVRSQFDRQDRQLIELEDGFIRSVGLGAEFARPLSWVADSSTLYFDSTQASDLEQKLNRQKLTDACIMSAKQFRDSMLKQGISKYNTGKAQWQRPARAIEQGKDVVLVTGQVEQDASIKYGAPVGSSNLALVQTARDLEPDAYLIYKPHPDVVAGARAKGSNEQQAWQIADEVVTDINITQMLPRIDRMHVLTSLAGFEGLLQGVDVVCHGLPFYAGWGLTTDIRPCRRRTAELTLDELVYGVYLDYPMYVSRDTGYFCSAQVTLNQLQLWRMQGERGKWLRKATRKVLNVLRSVAK